MRPSSPLSPHFDAATRPPFQRNASGKQQRRHFGHSLTLPGLPRFHPANFASSNHSSIANTPGTNPNSPHGQVAPSLQPKMYADAQRQMTAYQRDLYPRSPSATSHPVDRPGSPRLEPLGSPGPVTPLELETNEGYLHAKSPSRLHSSTQLEHSDELAEKLAQAQTMRQGSTNKSPRNSTANPSRSR